MKFVNRIYFFMFILLRKIGQPFQQPSNQTPYVQQFGLQEFLFFLTPTVLLLWYGRCVALVYWRAICSFFFLKGLTHFNLLDKEFLNYIPGDQKKFNQRWKPMKEILMYKQSRLYCKAALIENCLYNLEPAAYPGLADILAQTCKSSAYFNSMQYSCNNH